MLNSGTVKVLAALAAAVLAGIMAVLVVLITRLNAPGTLVLGSGGSDGAYEELAKTFNSRLARNGLTLQLRDDLQGFALLKALRDPKSGVDGGIIKGGLLGSMTGRMASDRARTRHDEEVGSAVSVGRLFLEPIWVFTRGGLPISSLRELEGKRILTGLRQSGTRRVALMLLRANGVNSENSVLAEKELSENAAELASGEADAAILILPPDAPRIQKLLRVPNIRLMNFSPEAAAYTNRFPALTSVVMHRASVEFEPVIPSADIMLLATSAALIVRRDLNPAVKSLLADAVLHSPKSPFDAAGDPVLFYRAGQFPSASDPEYDVPEEVRLVYKTGEPPMLLRSVAPLNEKMGLPFALTAFTTAYGVQSFLLLLPALTLLWPATVAASGIYRWSVRQRLIYWYGELKAVDRRVERDGAEEDRETRLAELERVDAAVRRMRVPLEFSDQLYDLRGHIELVRQRLAFMR